MAEHAAVRPAVLFALAAASVRAFAATPRQNVLRMAGSATSVLAEAVGVVILLEQFGGIGGWTTGEVLLLLGVADAGLGLGMLLAEPLEPPTFSQLLRDGRFDQALTRPMSPLLWVLATDVQIRHAGRTLAGVGILAAGVVVGDVTLSVGDVGLLTAAILADAAIAIAVLTIGAAITMWTVEGTEVLNSFTYGGAVLAGWPLDIYQSALRAVFLWVVPVGAAVYLPVLAVVDRPGVGIATTALLPLVPVLVAAFCGAASLAWRAGLRHHTGAGG